MTENENGKEIPEVIKKETSKEALKENSNASDISKAETVKSEDIPPVAYPDMLTVEPSPHIKHKDTARTLMINVLIALTPAVIYSAFAFGYRAILLTALSVISCILFEWGYEKITKRQNTVSDCSAALTGVLLAMKTAITEATKSAGTASTITELLRKIRDCVDEFQFINSKYVLAGIENRTSLDDIYIVMPFKIKNSIDIDAMAYMFNMEKADLLAKIRVTDMDDGCVYILDRRAVFQYNRLLELTEQWNGKALLTNYWYTVDDMYGYSPLFKATYIDASAILNA